MKFDIEPNKGFKTLPLRSNRQDVRSIFSEAPESKKAVPWDISESDYYDDYGLRLSFDSADCLESIGFLTDTDASLLGINLKNIKLKKLLKELSSRGFNPLEDKDDQVLYFDDFALAIFLDGKRIEAFELYMDDYVDRKLKLSKKADEFLQEQLKKEN